MQQLLRRDETNRTPSMFNDFFDSIFRPFDRMLPDVMQWSPRVDVSETDNEFKITADIPGIDPKDVSIEVEGSTLYLNGKTEQEKRDEDQRWYRVERQVGEFSRTFTLPPNVKFDEIDAEYRNGTVTLTIPKTEETRGAGRKAIPLRGAGEQDERGRLSKEQLEQPVTP